MYAALKGSGCDAMLRIRGRVVRETPLFVSPSAHLGRLSDRSRRLKESFGQLGQQPWPRPAMPCCATDAGPIRSDRQACLVSHGRRAGTDGRTTTLHYPRCR
jgi:hypothetical protein